MNTLESYTIDTPFGEIEKCSKFVIDDVLTPFTLHDIVEYGQQYTLSLWIRTDSNGETEDETETTDMSILVRGAEMSVSGKWTRYTHTFSAFNPDLQIYFKATGTYYIYRPQLERGTVATDWAESPLDTEAKIKDAQDAADKASQDVKALIQTFEDTISQLVTNAEGASLMTQTPDGGWTFCTAETEAAVKEVTELLNKFTGETSKALADLQVELEKNNLASYVVINDDDPMNPFIELGTVVKDEATDELISGEFKLRITNRSIVFMQDNEPVAYIDNQQLHIRKAVIEEELAVGGFVLKQHGSRNNVGFLWKGVTG